MTYSPNTALPSLRLFLTGGHEERKHNTKKGPALGSLLVETAVLVGHCGSLFRRDYLRVGKHFENQSKEAKEASVIAPWDPSWPPLPASGFISHPLELIRAAYAFAAKTRLCYRHKSEKGEKKKAKRKRRKGEKA